MGYDELRSTLELLNFASGPIVAVAAVVGLLQLIIAKRTAETANRRAAYELAIEQIKLFSNEIIPLSDAFRPKVEKAGDYTKEEDVTIRGDSVHVGDPEAIRKYTCFVPLPRVIWRNSQPT